MIETLQSIPWAIAALAVTIAVILLVGKLAQRAGLGTGPRSGRRLAVVETLSVDARRRLVIARVDGREAVLLVGGANDQVVCLLGTAAEAGR
ncbi:flagellar biosynthetic protein FliO [Elioraea sp.]|jgi:flagellar protein FliO/FliZ|uniref:flagellar biosynthetic protein FliO n=1 Tax=Elioraea sp. TaxID=2185103 RepID=UPI003F702562